jgi:glycosyltransferase involved in cell wall biosynthesis
MVRILHLSPTSADCQTEMGIAQLSRRDSGEVTAEIRRIGYGGDFATATAAVIALWRHGAGADVIHAWGEASLFVAALAAKQPVLYSPTEFPRQQAIRRLRAIMDYLNVQVVCPTDTMRRAFVEHGVPIQRCHLIRPGVDFARVNRRRDPALRAALGFGEDDQILLAVGESTRETDHPRAAWAAAVLHLMDRRNRLLLWGRGSAAPSVSRFIDRLEQPELCRIAADRLGRSVTFEQLLPAADIALVTARAPVETLPIAICMAAALPIVAVVNSTVSELLEDRHNAMLAGSNSPRAIARRVLDLRDDPNLQWKICDTARTEAYEYFSQTRFVEQFHAVYRQTAGGERVEVPQQAPGTGARFQKAH